MQDAGMADRGFKDSNQMALYHHRYEARPHYYIVTVLVDWSLKMAVNCNCSAVADILECWLSDGCPEFSDAW